MLYVGDEAEKQALLLGEPRLFFTAPGYDGWPLVMLRLAEVDAGRLAELVTDAWRMRAPARARRRSRGVRRLGNARPGPKVLTASPRFRRRGGRLAPSRASRSGLAGGPVTVTGGRTARHCRPVVIDSTARTAPVVSRLPCT